MGIPHELLNVGGVIVGQILHIVKKKTEEDTTASEGSILAKWVLKRPVNTVGAALVGAGASIGLTSAEVAAVMTPVMVFINAVIMGIAANSTINRPGTDSNG